ncbi:MAG: diaminopimelate decarboxylase [Gemmatimonas sp.]|nr:diaminopimelate decarboxylase [Gemmatimonas sp.]
MDAFTRREGELYCEDVPVSELVARWGTPAYVYSRTALRTRLQDLSDAFGSHPHLIAYSVKANGNLAVLRTLADMGAGADIVSGGELYRARLAGIPAQRILFSGVGKTLPELAAALREGIYAFNVESEGELRSLSELAQAMGKTAPIAFRINPNIDTPTPHAYTRTGHAATKFGVPIHDAMRLYRIASELPGIAVRGIDMHLGSQILAIEPYHVALEQALEMVARLKEEGHELEFLDLGGGLGISYSGGEGIPADLLADSIVPSLRETGLRLILEPGRYIVGHAGILLTRVLYVKEGGGKRFVVTDAGMNDLLRPSHYAGYHAVEPILSRDREHARVDVVGPICETGDFLALDREIERVEPGELLAVMTAGAYGFSMSSTYNQRPRPVEILVDGDRAELVRRRETIQDLVAAELDLTPEEKQLGAHKGIL